MSKTESFCEENLRPRYGSYAGSLIVETISSVENAPINSRSEGTFFTPTQDELESSNLRMGHVMVRKSYLRRFMFQFTLLYACYKVASGLSQRPCYVSQARPLYRKNHNSLDDLENHPF